MKIERLILAVAALVFAASSAVAQEEPRSRWEERWSAITFTPGFTTAQSDTGAALGGSFLHNLTGRLSLEGTAAYLDRGTGASALHVNASLLVHLLPQTSKYVPYFSGGGGVYRASFDLDDPRYLGEFVQQMGPRFGPGMMFDPAAFGAGEGVCPCGELPQFYLRRLGSMVVPASGVWGERSFTDPAVSFGGGARLELTPRLFLRPDARALVVAAEGDTFTVGLFTLQIGILF
jgi:hypothetical protein